MDSEKAELVKLEKQVRETLSVLQDCQDNLWQLLIQVQKKNIMEE